MSSALDVARIVMLHVAVLLVAMPAFLRTIFDYGERNSDFEEWMFTASFFLVLKSTAVYLYDKSSAIGRVASTTSSIF